MEGRVAGGELLMLSLFVSSESDSCADWVNDPSVRWNEEGIALLVLRRLRSLEDRD